MANIKEVTIIGSGPAGYTAAIYAARADLKPVLYTGMEPGGQLTTTTEVDNFPGYPEGIDGPTMMVQLQQQAERFGTEVRVEMIEKVELARAPKGIHRAFTAGGTELHAKTIIISTGATAKYLGLPSEQRLRGGGVSACAVCDGFFYKGRDVAVIGGGNPAVEEALYLANICNHVTLVHRRDSLRAEQIMQERLLKKANITVEWNRQVAEVLGDESGVTGLRLAASNGGDDKMIAVHGMFVAIGHDPATAAFAGAVTLDDEGYIIAHPGRTHTSVNGIFAAGDCVDKIYRQAVTAAGMGCMAALDTERWLGEQER